MSDFYLEDFSEVESIKWNCKTGTITVMYKNGSMSAAFAHELLELKNKDKPKPEWKPQPGWKY